MTETVRVETSVAAGSPEAAFQFVVDVENYSRCMPNVNSVRIVEHSGGFRVTHWDTEIEGAPLIWSERDSICEESYCIRFECVEGDFDVFRGLWEVLPGGGPSEVRVACELEYSVGIPVIEEVLGPVLRQKIAENLTAMLAGLAAGIAAGDLH